MWSQCCFYLIAVFATTLVTEASYIPIKKSICGSYGFTCFGNHKLRLCDHDTLYGPTFLCPENTFCNEESNDVCDGVFSFINPINKKNGIGRCKSYERIADYTVPGCKGYILCIPNKNKFQGVKFKCAGNTVFNGRTRTCSSAERYRCPQTNSTEQLDNEDTQDEQLYTDFERDEYVINNKPFTNRAQSTSIRPIDCKNYKFSVRQDANAISKVAYFCPSKPLQGESLTRCTVFSNNFCLTLQKEEEDQFLMETRRKPRIQYV